jgi:carbon catabolite-derepressing protein kinase
MLEIYRALKQMGAEWTDRGPEADPFMITARWLKAHEDGSVMVYLDVQLYQLEPNNFLVDFKCAGYERVEERAGEGLDRYVKDEAYAGKKDESEKEVTSAFPFLDVASKLIMSLM